MTLRYEPGTIVAEGDYMIVHGRFMDAGRPKNRIAADVVRMESGLLGEHWDVLQARATQRNRGAASNVRERFPG